MSSFLSERARSGRAAFAAWCGLPEPSNSAVLAREAFDAIVLDLQHGAIDFAAAVRAIPGIVAAGKPAIARIPVGDFATASRFLDAGVAGVIAPMINSLEDARLFASFMKYPPIGSRSWGPHGALTFSGLGADDYFRKANGLSSALAMVETREALAVVDEILAEPGIDGVFIGPSDLSIALSGGAALDPEGREVEEAIAHVLNRTKAAGKVAAIYAASGEKAAEWARKGFHLISIGTDAGLLRMGAEAALKAARG
ncbi:HpcH/HpaI aldolase family protein [Microvirga flavescens]|uniref:HpcH/HpaI aldolase family protein n=1 Tax=Microvirga flavescens TaxID=2249811 RepID=UPI000DDAEF4D|nr:aldolase/citrate lyase family protein [Microvirga flavescens]